MKVLWLRPTVGTHTSTRRERIKEGMASKDVNVDIIDSSGSDAFSAVKTALTGNYDLIVGTVRMGVYLGYPLAKLLSIPFVAEITEPIERYEENFSPITYRLLKWYEWNILERADARFFVESNVLQKAENRGLEGHLTRNSVWFEKFADPDSQFIDKARASLQDLEVDFDAPIAIYIGRLSKRQHIPQILEAAQSSPSWEFIFLGEKGQVESVKNHSEKYENIHYAGVVPHEEIPGYLHFADVGFSLSPGERPLKFLEYAAAGLTVLGKPGRRENLFTKEQVHFIDPSSDTIIETLKTLHKHPEKIPATGPALQNYAKNHTWDEIADEYYNTFRELLSE